jgi:crossover junction endodeoxyribonuclease RuvC
VGITPQQLTQLQDRLSRPKRKPVPAVLASPVGHQARPHEVILGIDPSLRGTGYGVIRAAKPQAAVLAQGTIKCPASWEATRCLGQIARTIREVISTHRPTACIVEGLFFAQNLRTAIIMGEARGAGLAVVAEAGLEVYEMSPRKMKQAIVGHGAAQKEAVARMVQRMLRLSEMPAPDAADALALALAYLQETSRFAIAGPKRI